MRGIAPTAAITNHFDLPPTLRGKPTVAARSQTLNFTPSQALAIRLALENAADICLSAEELLDEVVAARAAKYDSLAETIRDMMDISRLSVSITLKVVEWKMIESVLDVEKMRGEFLRSALAIVQQREGA